MTSKRYTEQQLQDLLVLGIAAANAELAALKAKQGTGTTSDNYRAELYDLLLQVGRDMGYPNVTMALTELATLKARAGEPIAILDFDDLFPNSHWSQPEHRFMWQIELDEIRALPKRDIPLYTTPQPTPPKKLARWSLRFMRQTLCFEPGVENVKAPRSVTFSTLVSSATVTPSPSTRREAAND